jgi:predicted enzyme related to lactoylglutathione lyase
MAHQVPQKHIRDVIVECRHALSRYTDCYYGIFCLIATPEFRRYSPRVKTMQLLNPKGDEMIRAIKFVGIPVRNQDAALKFYTEKLGFKVSTDQYFNEKQRWIELAIPGAESGVVLFTPEGHEKRIGEFQSISFRCDDVFATAKILKSKGVEFTSEPKKEDWGTSAVIKDPDGNQFVLSSK